MPPTIRAGLRYFAIVLGTGFVLGMFRVPILLPHSGQRWAKLVEMPVMAAVVLFAAGSILRRFRDIRQPGRSWLAGFLASALIVCVDRQR